MSRRAWWLIPILVGCNSASGATCPTNNTLTYENFGRAFVARYCYECHNGGALVKYTLEGVRSSRIDGAAAAGPDRVNDDMPPTGDRPIPTLDERQRLGQWIACGAP